METLIYEGEVITRRVFHGWRLKFPLYRGKRLACARAEQTDERMFANKSRIQNVRYRCRADYFHYGIRG